LEIGHAAPCRRADASEDGSPPCLPFRPRRCQCRRRVHLEARPVSRRSKRLCRALCGSSPGTRTSWRRGRSLRWSSAMPARSDDAGLQRPANANTRCSGFQTSRLQPVVMLGARLRPTVHQRSRAGHGKVAPKVTRSARNALNVMITSIYLGCYIGDMRGETEGSVVRTESRGSAVGPSFGRDGGTPSRNPMPASRPDDSPAQRGEGDPRGGWSNLRNLRQADRRGNLSSDNREIGRGVPRVGTKPTGGNV
jgi:hypothetical protein